MEVGGTYSNTKDQVNALESLRRKLPDLDAPAPPPPQPRRPRRVRQLGDDQVQQLIAGYQSGSTVYELADRFAIGRNTVCRILHRHNIPTHRQGLSADLGPEHNSA